MNETQRFQAVLETGDESSATSISIPFDVPQAFGKRGRVPVKGTIEGVPYRSSIFRMGEAPYFMVVNRKLREAGGLVAGQRVAVVMERDDAPRTIEPPDDLERALRDNPAVWTAWERLSFTHQREYVEAVEDAKRPETRARRIVQTVEKLSAKTGG